MAVLVRCHAQCLSGNSSFLSYHASPQRWPTVGAYCACVTDGSHRPGGTHCVLPPHCAAPGNAHTIKHTHTCLSVRSHTGLTSTQSPGDYSSAHGHPKRMSIGALHRKSHKSAILCLNVTFLLRHCAAGRGGGSYGNRKRQHRARPSRSSQAAGVQHVPHSAVHQPRSPETAPPTGREAPQYEP